jgi:hypothetical protein
VLLAQQWINKQIKYTIAWCLNIFFMSNKWDTNNHDKYVCYFEYKSLSLLYTICLFTWKQMSFLMYDATYVIKMIKIEIKLIDIGN